MKNPDYQLAKNACQGNTKAFEQLIKSHYQQIYRTAFLYVHNQEDALDIVQESTYQALISIHTLKNPEYFMTWFTKILIRCSGQLLEKRKNIVPLTEEILVNIQTDHSYIHPDSLLLLDAISQLNEHYQTVIILFYYHDYSIRTISEVMNIPESTVKTYLSRGKNTLKKYFLKERNNG